MSEAFLRHLFPTQFRVLGRILPPLSLWHLAGLEAVDSPFAGRSDSISLWDIQVAVKVCTTRWPNQPKLTPTFRDNWQQWRHGNDAAYIREHAEAMAAHLQLHSLPPELYEQVGEQTREISAPPILARVAAMVRLPAFSNDDIWNNTTPGYFSWLMCAITEREQGNVRFSEPDDTPPPPQPILNNEADVRALAKAQGLSPEKTEIFVKAFRERRRTHG